MRGLGGQAKATKGRAGMWMSHVSQRLRSLAGGLWREPTELRPCLRPAGPELVEGLYNAGLSLLLRVECVLPAQIHMLES